MQVSQGEPPPGHSRDGVYHFKMPSSSGMSSESSPQVGEGWDRPLPESQMLWVLISLINSSFLHRLPEVCPFSTTDCCGILDNATGQYWTCLPCPGTDNDLMHLYSPFIFQEHLDLWAHFSFPVAKNWWTTSFLEKSDTARLSISTLPLQMWLAHPLMAKWEWQWTDRCYAPPACSSALCPIQTPIRWLLVPAWNPSFHIHCTPWDLAESKILV